MVLKITKRKSFSFLFGLIALIIIVCDILGIGLANLILNINPILRWLFLHHYHNLIVNEELQLKEPSSFLIHYNFVGYLIHFICFLLFGMLIDLIYSKLLFSKVSKT